MANKTALASCLLLLPLVGCSLIHSHRELEAPDRAFGEVWIGLQQVTRRLGYPADREETDRGKRVFQSKWRLSLRWQRHPTTGRGSTRDRLRVEVLRLGADRQGWLVRYYVELQVVTNMAYNLNPREEHWEPAGQDTDKEAYFKRTLRLELGLPAIEASSGPTRRPELPKFR